MVINLSSPKSLLKRIPKDHVRETSADHDNTPRYNAFHAALEELPTECHDLAKKVEKDRTAGQEWQLLGVKKGLPKTWDDVERLPKCEHVMQEEVKVALEAMSGAVEVGGSSRVVLAIVAIALAF